MLSTTISLLRYAMCLCSDSKDAVVNMPSSKLDSSKP